MAVTPVTVNGSGNQAGGTSNQWNVTKPSGTVADDILVASLYKENSAAPTASGWTLLGAFSQARYPFWIWVYARRLGGEAGPYPITWSGDTWAAGTWQAWRGVDPALTIEEVFELSGTVDLAVEQHGSALGTAAICPAFTTATDDARVVAIGISGNDSAKTPPAGYTELIDPGFNTSVNDKAGPASAGAVASASVGITSNEWMGIHLSIRSAGSGIIPDPAFVAAGAAAFTATSAAAFVPGLPAGWAEDDVHLLICHNSGNVDFVDPAGWILLNEGNNGSAQRANLYARRAVAGDAGPSISMASNVTTVRGGRIYGFRNIDPDFDLSTLEVVRDDNAASATIGSVSMTPNEDGMMVVFLHAYEDDPSARSLPAGYTASGTVATSSLGNDASIAGHHKLQTTAAAENPSTVVSGGTFTNSVNVSYLIALPRIPEEGEEEPAVAFTGWGVPV